MKSNEQGKKRRKGKTYKSDGDVEACAPVGPRGVARQLVYHPRQGRRNNNPEMKEDAEVKKWSKGDLMNRSQLVREDREEGKRGNKKLFGDKLISMTWRG